MENTKYGRRREGRWTPIRAKAQDTRANPNSSETHLVRKRWDIGLLRALNPRIKMMMMMMMILYIYIYIYISRVDKQRCITARIFESAYLISKFAEFYALSCWQKCIIYNEHQSLWSKSCSNNAYLLGRLRFVWQKCISLIHC